MQVCVLNYNLSISEITSEGVNNQGEKSIIYSITIIYNLMYMYSRGNLQNHDTKVRCVTVHQ